MKGIFISFEGIDGCGKTTQIELAATYLKKKSLEFVITREPGGCRISEQIRTILLDAENMAMRPKTEALLYAASRIQHLDEQILPALLEGKIVLCDRFLDSSEAYQGYGRKLGSGYIRGINAYALEHMPDLTFYFRCSPKQSRVRMGPRQTDRLEQENIDFFERVCEGYEQIASRDKERIFCIDATANIEKIAEQVQRHIQNRLSEEE